MGLKATGEKGAKAYLRTNCKRAFRVYPTLLETRKAVGATRAQTAVLLDMNVILMSIPESVTTLAGCVRVVWSFVEWAVGTGALTVCVFDEPQAMTNAKKAEQARRDQARASHKVACSDDLEPCPLTDDFTAAQLEALPNVLPLRDHRPTRSRLYDEITKRVYAIAAAKAEKWNASGKPEHLTRIVMDGVDMRGCERPKESPRQPVMTGNNEALVQALQRDRPIGEGDIKLQQLDGRIRELAVEGGVLEGTTLIMASTIDTDSLMISALSVSKRRIAPYMSSVHTVLCMRTAVTKAQKEANPDATATYLVCDTAMLEGMMQQHIWGLGAQPTPEQMLNAMLAMSASAALAGCDFVELSGARFDHFFDSLKDFVTSEPTALEQFGAALAPDAPVARQACQSLIRVCYTASKAMEDKPRYKKQAQSVFDCDDATLRRAVWTAAYWAENEFEADEDWGFQPVRGWSSAYAALAQPVS